MEREQLKVLWDGIKACLERAVQRRQYAATLSNAYGYGGAVVVHEITGLALNTITRGKKEVCSIDLSLSGKELGNSLSGVTIQSSGDFIQTAAINSMNFYQTA